MTTSRNTVLLAKFPDLVVIYLGMRVNAPRGLVTLMRTGQDIKRALAGRPDGLLRHENFVLSLLPPHLGMRQYWRDFESLERWARSPPHRQWWSNFLRDSRGTGFWHETYSMRGGIAAIYDDIGVPLGLSAFAAKEPARGPMFGARLRLRRPGDSFGTPAVDEAEL